MTTVDLRNWVVSAQYPIYERVAVIAEHVAQVSSMASVMTVLVVYAHPWRRVSIAPCSKDTGKRQRSR